MKALFSLFLALPVLIPTVSARCDEAVFKGGAISGPESFGRLEGMVWFSAGAAAVVAIYALIFWSRSVHRRTEKELRELSQLLEEKPS